MKRTLTLEDFYLAKVNDIPDNLAKGIGHFNVFKLDDYVGKHSKPIPYSRKDFYKISLIIGQNDIYYADKSVVIKEQAVLFANPQIPYSFKQIDENQSGYFCIFTEDFFEHFGALKEYPMFQPNGNPIIDISKEQICSFEAIFLKMFEELNSDYAFKYDALRNLVFDLIHLSLKTQPDIVSSYRESTATLRVSSMFMELLERQFPIESKSQRLTFRSASEFANQLNVHVNHLNKALKETTGRTTSQIIADRIIQESKILLKHTNWNIKEIAWSLYFDESSYFSNFFKKHLQITPNKYRSHPID